MKFIIVYHRVIDTAWSFRLVYSRRNNDTMMNLCDKSLASYIFEKDVHPQQTWKS